MDNLTIMKIWADINMVELLVEATCEDASAKVSFYTCEEEIKNIKKKLSSWFPKNKNDELNIEFGSINGLNIGYIRLRLFMFDKLGHVGIEVEINNNLSGIKNMNCRFYIKTDISSVNRFGKELTKLIEDDSEIIKL